MKSEQLDQKYPKLGIVIYDTYEEESDIRYTIDSLKNINYVPHRAKIVITTKHKEYATTYMNMVDQLQALGFYAEFVLNVKDSPKSVVDFDVCKRCLNTDYIIKMEPDSIMPQIFLDNIMKSHNDISSDVKLFEYKDIAAVTFDTANDQYLKYNDFHTMIKELRKEFIFQEQYEKVG